MSPRFLGVRRRVVVSFVLLWACSAVVGCGRASAGGGGTMQVVANFYPVEFLARRVGGEAVSVTDLTPPGTEPHDLALTGKSAAALVDADAVFYLGAGFQPDVERAVAGLSSAVRRVDLLTVPGMDLSLAPSVLGEEALAGGKDPHVWLDPVRMKAMAVGIADSYLQADPARAGLYRANLAALQRDLDVLDATLRAAMTGCRQTAIVTSHAAFGYFADRYGLRQIPISGLSPDAEPDTKTLAGITKTARDAGVGTVFGGVALSVRRGRGRLDR
jgi:zinc transport system substrate-binding protein